MLAYIVGGLPSISFCLVPLDVGFEIPNRFVVGYALDYNEYFRDLDVSFRCCFLPICSHNGFSVERRNNVLVKYINI